MKFWILIIAFIFLSSTTAFAGYFPYWEFEENFGLKFGSTVCDICDSVIIAKADSGHFAETGKHYSCRPRILGKGYFHDFPFVNFYHIWTCDDIVHSEYPEKLILYNGINGAYYHFSGSLFDFNKVFCDYLDRDHSFINTMNLIHLYISTQYPIGPVKIIFNPEDFDAFYDTLFIIQDKDFEFFLDSLLSEMVSKGELPSNYESELSSDPADISWISRTDSIDKEQLRTEKHAVLDSLKPLKWDMAGDKIRIEFYSFGGFCSRNSIEHWIFDVYLDSLSIVKRDTVFTKLGKWKPVY